MTAQPVHRRWHIPSVADADNHAVPVITTRQRHVLAYLDVIFWGYCLVVAVVATTVWVNGRGSLRTVWMLLGFLLAHSLISRVWSRLPRREFAARAGAEIARQDAELALRRLNAELEARISERTDELQAALTEKSQLSAVLEATTDVVGVAALDGRIHYLNRAGRERLAVPPDADIGTFNMSTFYTPRSLEVMMNEGIPAAMRNGNWSGELIMRSLSGQEIPISISGHVHFDADGLPTYVSAIGRDIAESKRIAAELQRAKEAAEAANRAKSTFLATMSHEIRTPMNAVIGMTDLLLTTSLTPKQRDFVDTIRSGGDSLLTVINDILDFSKIEAGKLELERRAFDVRTALESAVDLLAPRAAEKGIELALSVDPVVPAVVVGDETRIRQILVNLAGNAIKFTDCGEVVVSVTAGARTSDTARVELLFSVRDTGVGIPPAKQHRLFTSFSQLDTSTTREYGGTGLGLAISKRLAELMGGTIWVESEGVPGRGSVFQFTIQVGSTAIDKRPSHLQIQPALAGRRVLVVDDNATNRHILGLQLQSWGMLAVQAAGHSDALGLLRRRERFDLVILDMQMPGMDGVALAKAICAERSAQRLPIVMLTSLGRALGSDAEAMGCFAGHLTKPVKASQLYDAIVSAIVGREDLPQDPQASAPRSVPDATVPSPEAFDILLAEDMEVNCKFALLALEELGYRAAVAANGAEVLRALEQRRYDVILMDVQMPEVDGLEATRRIRRDWPTDRQPHIVAMTANAMEGDREMCIDAGMDDYLSKPVYLDELRAVLQRAAERIVTSRSAAIPVASTAALMPVQGTSRQREMDTAVLDRDRTRSSGPELADLFLKEATETLHQLQVSAEHRDLNGVREAAHRLKGSSGYLGANRLMAVSARIERAARAGEPVEVSEVRTVEAELTTVRQELREIFSSALNARSNVSVRSAARP